MKKYNQEDVRICTSANNTRIMSSLNLSIFVVRAIFKVFETTRAKIKTRQ